MSNRTPNPRNPKLASAIDAGASLILSRRAFLLGLATAGAALAFAVPVTAATDEQVDEAWDELMREPFVFNVTDDGTIEDGQVSEPHQRSDVYSIDTSRILTPKDLIGEVTGLSTLVDRFEGAAADELDEVHGLLDDEEEDPVTMLMLYAKKTAIQQGGWEGWVRHEGSAGLPQFRKIIDDWLDGSIWEDDVETWPLYAFPTGSAFRFFEGLEYKICQSLGVVVVDGDHPGSSYRGAELRNDVLSANATAAELGLPFRFRQA